MNLVIDIGNSRSKIGLFEGSRLLEHELSTDWTPEQYADYCNQKHLKHILLSTVVDRNIQLIQTLSQSVELLEFTHETRLPFENRYTTPQTLGQDRLAAVAGAQALMPGTDCLVIDCGTCIKYDLITSMGSYQGGNIAPGAQMRAKAMHVFTAKLPEVSLEMPGNFIGNSTQTALQNGAFLGALLEIKGFIQLFQQNYPLLNLILTGGDAAFFQTQLPVKNLKLEPNLTLYGLNNILIFNTPEGK